MLSYFGLINLERKKENLLVACSERHPSEAVSMVEMYSYTVEFHSWVNLAVSY